jgi:hypothetical protein
LRVLISEGEGDGVGDAIRVDGRGPGFNPSAWIRVDGRGPAPASSLIKNTPHKDPNFGASGARGNPAPLSSTSHRQLTLPPTPPPPSIQHLPETNTCACRGSPRTWTPQSLTSSAPLGNARVGNYHRYTLRWECLVGGWSTRHITDDINGRGADSSRRCRAGHTSEHGQQLGEPRALLRILVPTHHLTLSGHPPPMCARNGLPPPSTCATSPSREYQGTGSCLPTTLQTW